MPFLNFPVAEGRIGGDPGTQQRCHAFQRQVRGNSESVLFIDNDLSGVTTIGRGLTIFLIAIVGDDQTISAILLKTCITVGALPTSIDEAANAGEDSYIELSHPLAHL